MNNNNPERPKPSSYLGLAIVGRILLCVVLRDDTELHECFLKAFSHDDLLLDTPDGDVLVNRTEVRLIRGETKDHHRIAYAAGRK